MNFTLSDCISRINQILNYPSTTYEDISHFFDHAIAELNTNLGISLPTISELVANTKDAVSARTVHIMFASDPGNSTIPIAANTTALGTATGQVYFDSTRQEFGYRQTPADNWQYTPSLLGAYINNTNPSAPLFVKYQAVMVSSNLAAWAPFSEDPTVYTDLTTVLPVDWITLFIIPYVCFKYAVRDGNDGTLYYDEYSQGFQQLQVSYAVPAKVLLSTVAGLPAYDEDVKKYLPNLTRHVQTKAITPSMKIGRSNRALYGGVFDVGGWGI